MPLDYYVHIEQFEGPLDLLLHLVRESQLDITEISLAKVAQQYFDYLEEIRSLNFEIESSYLVVFAQLLELKSRLLLPEDPEELEDLPWSELIDPAGEIGDQGVSLTEKLNVYAAVVEASEWLQKRESLSLLRYSRQSKDSGFELPVELDVSLESLAAVYRRLHKRKIVNETPVKIEKITVSVPERIEELKKELEPGQVTDFIELLHWGDIPDIVVTFLSLLELVREHKLSLQQEGTLGRIKVAVF